MPVQENKRADYGSLSVEACDFLRELGAADRDHHRLVAGLSMLPRHTRRLEQILQILLIGFCENRVGTVSTYQATMADFGGYKTIRADLEALQDLELIELRRDDRDRRTVTVWPMQALVDYYNITVPELRPAAVAR